VVNQLLLWLWGIHVMLLLAVGWTLGVLVLRCLEGATRQTATKFAGMIAAGAAVAFTLLFAVEAVGIDYDRRDSRVLGALVPQTVSVLENEHGSSYFVEWDHAAAPLGRGMMNELDRRGFHVAAGAPYRAEVRPHRVMKPEEADAVIAVVGGPDIETWRAQPGVRQIAYTDLTGADQAEPSDELGTAVFLAAPPRA